ncbi:MAG: hypothetical protein IT210_06505 [Armatimonadetes bacterium]|nr:hypothetical protein [Armatimonadota bacterium]
MKVRHVVLFWAVASALGGPLQAVESPGKERPRGPAVKVSSPPRIDGRVEEGCWEEAARIEAFWRTDRDAPFPEATEAMICYDDRAIYIAFCCRDSEPRLIRSQQRKRGGDLDRDDAVRILLDPLNQPRSDGAPYGFTVNPAGTQREAIPGGAAAKIEWRGEAGLGRHPDGFPAHPGQACVEYQGPLRSGGFRCLAGSCGPAIAGSARAG